jgi:hypothetical protein
VLEMEKGEGGRYWEREKWFRKNLLLLIIKHPLSRSPPPPPTPPDRQNPQPYV